MGLEVMVGQQDYRCPRWIERVVLYLRRVYPLRRVPSSAFLNRVLSCYALHEAMYFFDASRIVKCVSRRCSSYYALREAVYCLMRSVPSSAFAQSDVMFELLCSFYGRLVQTAMLEAVYCLLCRVPPSAPPTVPRATMPCAKRCSVCSSRIVKCNGVRATMLFAKRCTVRAAMLEAVW